MGAPPVNPSHRGDEMLHHRARRGGQPLPVFWIFRQAAQICVALPPEMVPHSGSVRREEDAGVGLWLGGRKIRWGWSEHAGDHRVPRERGKSAPRECSRQVPPRADYRSELFHRFLRSCPLCGNPPEGCPLHISSRAEVLAALGKKEKPRREGGSGPRGRSRPRARARYPSLSLEEGGRGI